MKRISFVLILLLLVLSACGTTSDDLERNAVKIHLSDEGINVDGKPAGTDATSAVYTANDIVYYESGKDFTYGEGTEKDAHSVDEADAHTVVHIAQAGTYSISGMLSHGQIAIDLGEEAKDNPDAVVTLILNGTDVTCEVAPAIIFYNVYECGKSDEDNASKDVDTSHAGANVIIADGTINTINGSYVEKIYKSDSVVLNENKTEIEDAKKLHKYDGAFYSKMSMNVNGGKKNDGILNINAKNEGLNSELHLTINGGIINITSGNDGINTNEDNVSVTTINGGTLNILCDGATGEGDGIDSNGWLVINGGTVIAQACATSGDAGIDSDKGIYINGGKVIATGNMLDHIAGGDQTYAVLSFLNRQNSNNAYTLKNSDKKIVGEYAPVNAFTYLIIAGNELVPGDYTFWQGDTQLTGCTMKNMQGGMPQGERPETPQGEQNRQDTPPEVPEGMGRPESPNGERPQMPNGEMQQQGERPEMPEGMENMTPPDNMGGMPGGNMIPRGETSITFTIEKGGNQFAYVSPVESSK